MAAAAERYPPQTEERGCHQQCILNTPEKWISRQQPQLGLCATNDSTAQEIYTWTPLDPNPRRNTALTFVGARIGPPHHPKRVNASVASHRLRLAMHRRLDVCSKALTRIRVQFGSP